MGGTLTPVILGRNRLTGQDAQYGIITTSTNLVNTVLPIIGGIGMDYYGAG